MPYTVTSNFNKYTPMSFSCMAQSENHVTKFLLLNCYIFCYRVVKFTKNTKLLGFTINMQHFCSKAPLKILVREYREDLLKISFQATAYTLYNNISFHDPLPTTKRTYTNYHRSAKYYASNTTAS